MHLTHWLQPVFLQILFLKISQIVSSTFLDKKKQARVKKRNQIRKKKKIKKNQAKIIC